MSDPIKSLLDHIVQTRPGFDEALDSIRRALEPNVSGDAKPTFGGVENLTSGPRNGLTTNEIDPAALAEAYRLWPDPHDQQQGLMRYGFLKGCGFSQTASGERVRILEEGMRKIINSDSGCDSDRRIAKAYLAQGETK